MGEISNFAHGIGYIFAYAINARLLLFCITQWTILLDTITSESSIDNVSKILGTVNTSNCDPADVGPLSTR